MTAGFQKHCVGRCLAPYLDAWMTYLEALAHLCRSGHHTLGADMAHLSHTSRKQDAHPKIQAFPLT